ncbi:hypothetical protein BJ170DRAFT_425095 [Xylariales sp. AK1849]|nr:hypothetical protein BJ170DRAFT_425095 [Xylariales sp. AK1849]
MRQKSVLLGFLTFLLGLALFVNAASLLDPSLRGISDRGVLGPGKAPSKGGKGGDDEGGAAGSSGKGEGTGTSGGIGGIGGGTTGSLGQAIGGVSGTGSLGKSVTDYGLTREFEDDVESPAFIAPYLPKVEGATPPTWEEASILNEAKVELCHYAFSSDKTNYVTMDVNLIDPVTKERATDMKYRDMMIDNYITSTGSTDLKSWTTIGAENIINDDVKDALKNGFIAQKKGDDFDKGGTTTFTPGGPGWDEVNTENVFASGADQMLQENAVLFGNARVRSIVVSTEKNKYGALLVNMVTVLVR